MKDKIKELRIKIDGLSQLVKECRPTRGLDKTYSDYPYDGTKEINKSYDSLILAKAWLGKVLGELGQETPYKNDGKRKTVEDIEETADTSKNHFEVSNNLEYWGKDFNNLTHIEKVDFLREEIKKLINNYAIFNMTGLTYYGECAIDNYYQHLSEARFWLGLELGRIRENEQQK